MRFFARERLHQTGGRPECSTVFQVNDGKSTPIIRIDDAASGETASHLSSFLTFLEIGATLLPKKKRYSSENSP